MRAGARCLEVPDLAHVRLVDDGVARGRVRRAGGGGAPRAGRGAGRGARARLGRLPKMADWAEARRADPGLLTEWQVYRMVDVRPGGWAAFQFLVRARLRGWRRRGVRWHR